MGHRRLEPGSIVLSPSDCRMLYQSARIGELRTRHRVGDSELYALLTDISVCAFTTDADLGTEPRHDAASEEREWWTVRQLARAAGVSDRKVRLDAQEGRIPATKHNTGWLIARTHAETYLDGR